MMLSQRSTMKTGDAMDGPALLAAQTYVNQLRDQNGPEDHSITLVTATPEDAVIHDHVVDHSVFVGSGDDRTLAA